jgi:hypothetical protein
MKVVPLLFIVPLFLRLLAFTQNSALLPFYETLSLRKGRIKVPQKKGGGKSKAGFCKYSQVCRFAETTNAVVD